MPAGFCDMVVFFLCFALGGASAAWSLLPYQRAADVWASYSVKDNRTLTADDEHGARGGRVCNDSCWSALEPTSSNLHTYMCCDVRCRHNPHTQNVLWNQAHTQTSAKNLDRNTYVFRKSTDRSCSWRKRRNWQGYISRTSHRRSLRGLFLAGEPRLSNAQQIFTSTKTFVRRSKPCESCCQTPYHQQPPHCPPRPQAEASLVPPEYVNANALHHHLSFKTMQFPTWHHPVLFVLSLALPVNNREQCTSRTRRAVLDYLRTKRTGMIMPCEELHLFPRRKVKFNVCAHTMEILHTFYYCD